MQCKSSKKTKKEGKASCTWKQIKRRTRTKLHFHFMLYGRLTFYYSFFAHAFTLTFIPLCASAIVLCTRQIKRVKYFISVMALTIFYATFIVHCWQITLFVSEQFLFSFASVAIVVLLVYTQVKIMDLTYLSNDVVNMHIFWIMHFSSPFNNLPFRALMFVGFCLVLIDAKKCIILWRNKHTLYEKLVRTSCSYFSKSSEIYSLALAILGFLYFY